MIELVAPGWYVAFADELHEMHRLRYQERLDWNVRTMGDFEIDSFDSLKPHCLLSRDSAGGVGGGVRPLPSTGPTMLRDVFSRLLEERTAPEEPSVWESSRFALDLPPSAPKGSGSIAVATYQLLAGMIEFGLSRQLTHIVKVTELGMERILRRAGWPLARIGPPQTIGTTTMAVLAVPYCGPRCSARAPDMVMIGNDADWPDWQDEKSYRYTRHLTRRGWAWEFLRRNPAFQRDVTRALKQAEYSERRFGVEVMRSPVDLTRWGLLFRKLVEARCGCVLVLPPMPACSAAHCGKGIVARNAFI